nr:hypothetical protein B0A51_00450 [Rachicladosporium sp. CCFEE 5018]
MPFILSATLATTAFAAIASAAFNPLSKTNVAVYWGQGPYQNRLLTTCQNPSVDIVNVAFVNAFPDNSPGAWPGTNFGNQCGDQTYTHNGVSTLLKSNCPTIGSDIMTCQQTYGKKVLLSLGGGYPTNYYIANDTSANNFADFVWGAFGPKTAAWTNAGNPRPFGDAVVDGFDFDIESQMSPAPNDVNGNAITDYQSRGYATMITRLKNTLFGQDTSKSYYISGAPQCPQPDVHLSSVISQAWFDFLFVQFYNNPSCSARAAVTFNANDSLLHWTQTPSKNSAVRIYFGIPASVNASTNPSDYITQSEASAIVQRFSKFDKWGGISLWESQYSQNNVACGQDYTTWMKKIVVAAVGGTTLNTDTSNCPVTSTTSSTVQPTTTSSSTRSSSTLITTTTSSTAQPTTTSSTRSSSTLVTTTRTSSTTTSSTACATPTLTTVTFNEQKSTVYGESVYVIGDNAALGSWNSANAMPLSAAGYTSSNPQWSGSVKLPAGASVQYKFIKMGTDGSITWESDPNRLYTVPGNCAGTAVVGSTWR